MSGAKVVSIVAVLVIMVAIGISAMMANNDDSQQPYYSGASFNPSIALSVVYTCLAHLWVFGIRFQRKILQPLPPPLSSSSSSSSSSLLNKKVAIVTGSNTGIGYEAAKTLVVDYGWDVILACRSRDKALQAMEAINKEANTGGKAIVLEDALLDLSSFDSVRQFAASVQSKYKRIDVLINNAGLNTSGKSGDNLDLLFQSNFLGHFLLTNLLMEQLQPQEGNSNGNGGRIVNLSSVMHHFMGSQPKDTVEYWKSMALYSPDDGPHPNVYGASKLAMIFWTQELNRRRRDDSNSNSNDSSRHHKNSSIRSIVVSPGSCASDIWRGFPTVLRNIFRYVYLSPEQGSVPVVAAAVMEDWEEEDSVTYLQPYWNHYYNGKRRTPMLPFTEMLGPYVGYMPATPRLPPGGGLEEGKALWETSEELTKGT
jgi:NAD(P)-dependent dehydrogenase (short-subunit alcohol dehydrogenase family)